MFEVQIVDVIFRSVLGQPFDAKTLKSTFGGEPVQASGKGKGRGKITDCNDFEIKGMKDEGLKVLWD